VTLVASQFGSNLRRIRLERRLSQEDLMARADVHRTQISKYERGENEPQLEVIARLAWALSVSVDTLFARITWQESPPRLLVEASELDSKNGTPTVPSQRTGGGQRQRALRAAPTRLPTAMAMESGDRWYPGRPSERKEA
jgi:transcriptional regulator with XRE-family HTH domain